MEKVYISLYALFLVRYFKRIVQLADSHIQRQASRICTSKESGEKFNLKFTRRRLVFEDSDYTVSAYLHKNFHP